MKFIYNPSVAAYEKSKRRKLVDDSSKFAENFLEKFKDFNLIDYSHIFRTLNTVDNVLLTTKMKHFEE